MIVLEGAGGSEEVEYAGGVFRGCFLKKLSHFLDRSLSRPSVDSFQSHVQLPKRLIKLNLKDSDLESSC